MGTLNQTTSMISSLLPVLLLVCYPITQIQASTDWEASHYLSLQPTVVRDRPGYVAYLEEEGPGAMEGYNGRGDLLLPYPRIGKRTPVSPPEEWMKRAGFKFNRRL